MYEPRRLGPTSRRWLKNSKIPMRFHGLTFEDLAPYEGDETVRREITAWMEACRSGDVIRATGSDKCGLGLLFIGKPGHGKTTLAATIAQDLLRTVDKDTFGITNGVGPSVPIYFGYYPEILETVKRGFGDNDDATSLVDAMFGRSAMTETIRVLVIDDLGKEHRTTSRWAENFFDHLLRARYDRGLPTIITSNVPLKDWANTYGESMASFAQEALVPLGIRAPEGDRRR